MLSWETSATASLSEAAFPKCVCIRGRGIAYTLCRMGRVYILLAGGDKSSQQKDIEVAIALAKERMALR